MFGLSGEHLLIVAAVLLIFGPRKLPELGSSIGKALKNFREGLNSPSSSGQISSKTASEASAVQDAKVVDEVKPPPAPSAEKTPPTTAQV